MPTDILKVLADNPNLFDAVKQHLIDEFDVVEGLTEAERSDTQLGQMFRARIVGIQTINAAFKKIAALKTPAEKLGRVNKAR